MLGVTISLVLLVLTISLVSLTTNNWLVNKTKPEIRTGLWKKCNGKSCKILKNTSILQSSRIFTILTSIFALLSLISLIFIKKSQWHSETFLRTLLIFTSMSSLLSLVLFAIYRTNLGRTNISQFELGYSYYIQIIVLVLSFIATEISFYHGKI